MRLTLSSRLKSFKNTSVNIPASENFSDEKIKKLARIKISEKFTNINLGFLHAIMISIGGEAFLIAGPSGSGKSSVAKYFVDNFGAEILANDWVVVEHHKNIFFASDLNFENSLSHRLRCKVKGVIFINPKDDLERDAYVPNNQEFEQILNITLDDMDAKTAKKISSFWIDNKDLLPFYCVITRKKDVAFTAQSLLVILKRLQPKDSPIHVGIIGVGSVGIELASQLGKFSGVQNIHLYNRSKQTAAGLAIDLNQALYNNNENIYVAHDNMEDLFRRASVVFLTFRDKYSDEVDASLAERWRRVKPHADITRKIAETAAQAGFTGTIFMVTNPVDFLTYSYYSCTQELAGLPQRTFQMYGVGLEGDMARAIFYGRKQYPILSFSDISIYGNHSDQLALSVDLPSDQLASLTDQVINASSEVRSHTIRTVFGPVAAAVRSFQAFIENGTTYLTLIQEGSYIGRKVTFKFALPSVEPINDNPKLPYSKILEANKKNLKKFSHLI